MQKHTYRFRMPFVVLWVVTAGLRAAPRAIVPRDPRSLHHVLMHGTLDAVKALLATPAGRVQIKQEARVPLMHTRVFPLLVEEEIMPGGYSVLSIESIKKLEQNIICTLFFEVHICR